MKTVLLLSTCYYPSSSSGVHRIAAYAKYLERYDFCPIVITKLFSKSHHYGTYDSNLEALTDVCKVMRVDYYTNPLFKVIEYIVWKTLGSGRMDNRKPYLLYRNMYAETEKLLREECIYAIWATASKNPISHQIANRISLRHGIPWVADFRDLPDQTYNTSETRYAVRQEIATCASASAITVTTEELAHKLRARHAIPVFTISNGYDPEQYISAGVKDAPGFNINHFGVLYEHRNPAPLFEALDLMAQFNIDFKSIHVNFYGADPDMVKAFARPYRCSTQIYACRRLPYIEMVHMQQASQVLLLVASRGQGGAIPAKLYSYLASKRPILVVPGDCGGTDRIVANTSTGISLAKPSSIAEWLTLQYQRWSKTGTTMMDGNIKEIEKYSRKNQTGELAKVLANICL